MMICKPLVNLQDTAGTPQHFPAGFTEDVLANVSENCPPFHVTDDDIEPTLGVERLEVDAIVAHQFNSSGNEEGKSCFCTRRVGLA